MAHLMVHYPDGRQKKYLLNKPEMIVGRDSSCDIDLQDGIASREHAKFFRDPQGQYWIQDLKSKNGIRLNDQPIQKARIAQGDRIGIGSCQLILLADDRPVIILQENDTDTKIGSTSAWAVDQDLELPQKRLEILYRLNERLTGRLDRDDLLDEMLKVCTEQLRFERAGIAVWAGKPNPPQWIHLRNLRADASGEFRISRSVVDKALHDGERSLIVDTADGQMDPTVSMISNNIRSAMCVPMEYLQQVHGVIYGDRITSTGGYNKEDIDFFAALGRLGAMGLATLQLVDEQHRVQQVELQLQMARQIQGHLFPAEPMKTEKLEINAINDPGLEVSGDYYDYFTREDGKIVVVIADVAGKGVAASLLMANLQSAVQITLAKETNLAESVQSLNRLICKNVSDARFITAIFGMMDLEARQFTYVNAGHHGPYLIRGAKTVEKIEVEPNFPIGVIPETLYHTNVIDMPDHPSTLLFYTDGVPDATNQDGIQFEEQRLASTIEDNIGRSPEEIVESIHQAISEFTLNTPQTDDITIVAVKLT